MTSLTQNANANSLLAPAEMLRISEEINRRFSPLVSVKSMRSAKPVTLTSTELLEISADISRKFAPVLNDSTPKVVLLPVDPENLYLAWHLGRSETASTMIGKPESKPGAQDIVLRIFPEPGENNTSPSMKPWFDVNIEPSKNRTHVRVPEEFEATGYTAVLGKRDEDGRLTVFATSNVAQTPRPIGTLYDPETGEYVSNLTALSASSSRRELEPNIIRHGSGQGAN